MDRDVLPPSVIRPQTNDEMLTFTPLCSLYHHSCCRVHPIIPPLSSSVYMSSDQVIVPEPQSAFLVSCAETRARIVLSVLNRSPAYGLVLCKYIDDVVARTHQDGNQDRQLLIIAGDPCSITRTSSDSADTNPLRFAPFAFPSARFSFAHNKWFSERNYIAQRERQIYVAAIKSNRATFLAFVPSSFDTPLHAYGPYRDLIRREGAKLAARHTDKKGVLHLAADPDRYIANAWLVARSDRFDDLDLSPLIEHQIIGVLRATSVYNAARNYYDQFGLAR